MLNDSEPFTIVCNHCGQEQETTIGRLKRQQGLVCTNCGAALEDHTHKLEGIIANEALNPSRKLWLNGIFKQEDC